MRDHTYNGTPVSEMALKDIEDCLREGFVFNELDGWDIAEAREAVRARLELEVFIRASGLRGKT